MSIQQKTRSQIQEIRKKLKDRMGDLQYKNDDEVIDDALHYLHTNLKKNKSI